MPNRADERDPLGTDRRFFASLLAADAEELTDLLADDFVLIDVFQGEEIPRAALIDAVGTRQLRFDAIEVVESRARRYGIVAVITGRTEMRGHGQGQAWAARSRYTHVYAEQDGRWRLVSAQGTQIARE